MLSFFLLMIEDSNDKSQFETLYCLYKNEVMQYATALTKNHQDAEDIFQEAWFSLAKRFDEMKYKEEKIKPYIMKTVKHQAANIIRDKKRKEKYMTEENIDEMDSLSDSFDSVLLTICQHESVETIHKCINSLDEIYRDVLDFYYIIQSSPKAIADLLNLDVRTVRKRIHRGKIMLINLLVEKGEGNDNQI